MLRIGKDDLICDFAETYHIFDIYSLRPSVMATLAVGLRDDSRIKMRIAGVKVDFKTQLMAEMVDRLGILIWQRSKDGLKGKNRPKSVLDELTRDHSNDVAGFDDISAFERERKRILCQN